MFIRQAHLEDAPAIAKVNVDSWRTTYAGIVPKTFLDDMSYEEYENRWINRLSDSGSNIFIYVAEDQPRQIVGYVIGGPNRDPDDVYLAELYAIYLLQSHQGYGLGRMLTQRLVQSLLQADMHSMLLWVFAGNPAQHFYEALGGQRLRTNQFELAGIILEEYAYGWKDISILLKKHT